jgi:hypothetical protein
MTGLRNAQSKPQNMTSVSNQLPVDQELNNLPE